jgi:trimeric autotransporter adhesin
VAVLITNRPNQVVVSSPGPQGAAGEAGTGVTSIVAGTNVTISPVGGTGAVTVNAVGDGTGTVTSVATGTGLTGGPITTTGTITHQAQPVTGTGPAFVKSVEIDALGHVSSVVGETTAGAYRTATGTDDADNLLLGTVALARLPALAAAYTGQIETIIEKTYTIDPGVVAGRTITSFYARSGAGTCTATLYNAASVVGIVSVTTGSTTAVISNTTVAADSALTIVITTNIAATDVVFSVEFTQ